MPVGEAVPWAYDSGSVTAPTGRVLDSLYGGTEGLLSPGSRRSDIPFDPGTETFQLREARYALQCAYPEGCRPSEHPVKMVIWHGAGRCAPATGRT